MVARNLFVKAQKNLYFHFSSIWFCEIIHFIHNWYKCYCHWTNETENKIDRLGNWRNWPDFFEQDDKNVLYLYHSYKNESNTWSNNKISLNLTDSIVTVRCSSYNWFDFLSCGHHLTIYRYTRIFAQYTISFEWAHSCESIAKCVFYWRYNSVVYSNVTFPQ